jgi:hypothetical protein
VGEALLGRPERLPGFVERQMRGHVNQLLAMRMMIGCIVVEGIMAAERRQRTLHRVHRAGLSAYTASFLVFQGGKLLGFE